MVYIMIWFDLELIMKHLLPDSLFGWLGLFCFLMTLLLKWVKEG